MRDEKNHCLMSILSPNFVFEDEEEVDDLVRLLDSVRRGNAELVDRLLAAQSSSLLFNWTEDNTGFTLLHLAAATGQDNVVDVLLRNKVGQVHFLASLEFGIILLSFFSLRLTSMLSTLTCCPLLLGLLVVVTSNAWIDYCGSVTGLA